MGIVDPGLAPLQFPAGAPVELYASRSVPTGEFWPGPTKRLPQRSFRISGQAAVYLDFASGSIEAEPELALRLPAEGTVNDLTDGTKVDICVAANSSLGAGVLVEVAWPSSFVQAVARIHRDGHLEVLWFQSGERWAIERALVRNPKSITTSLRFEKGRFSMYASSRMIDFVGGSGPSVEGRARLMIGRGFDSPVRDSLRAQFADVSVLAGPIRRGLPSEEASRAARRGRYQLARVRRAWGSRP